VVCGGNGVVYGLILFLLVYEILNGIVGVVVGCG